MTMRFQPAFARRGIVRFRQYIVGGGLNSLRAIANLHAFCRRYLPGRHQIEQIDVNVQPARAARDGVVMTPTLVMTDPAPEQTIVGSLSDDDRLHALLDDINVASGESPGIDRAADERDAAGNASSLR